jgi:SAM-dependent methyltransferase
MTVPAIPPDLLERLRQEVRSTAPAEPEPMPPRRRRLRHYLPPPVRRLGRRTLNLMSTLLYTVSRPHDEQRIRSLVAAQRHQFVSREELTEWRGTLEAHLALAEAQLETLRPLAESLDRSLAALGEAIAPTAGISGVGPRFAELRERVNAVERRTRHAARATGVEQAQDPGSEASEEVAGMIDYAAFERRFRGDPEQIRDLYRERYVPLLAEHGPVLDIGCGKGELLEGLRGAGIEARGVDLDEGMVAEARARGLDAQRGDALSTLREQPEGSLGAIISVHLVEHVPLSYVIALLEAAISRLRPGGIFVAETPNPESLIVLGTHFIIDPTHLRPIHPALMVFLCESAGFRDVQLRFHSPATERNLPMIEGDDLPPWTTQINAALQRLNSVLFGPQEYAVVATRAPSHEGA